MHTLFRSRARLIGLNVALLGILALVSIGPGASTGSAQSNAAARSRGEYTLLSGRVLGATANGIWILDAANQELIALSWDRARDRMEPIGYRNLSDDAKFLKRPR
jgi:hypothetical protein